MFLIGMKALNGIVGQVHVCLLAVINVMLLKLPQTKTMSAVG